MDSYFYTMDWTKYPTLYNFVKKLPQEKKDNIEEVTAHPYEQREDYEDREYPIHEVKKHFLEFHKPTPASHEDIYVNTQTLWSTVCSLLEDTHRICNPSLRKSNAQTLIRCLKDYLVDKTILSFLTGRRVYPLLELLDKPRVCYEKKHQTALGYFLSFLLHKTVTINGEQYRWTRECEDSDIAITKNNQGYWSLDTKIKIENA